MLGGRAPQTPHGAVTPDPARAPSRPFGLREPRSPAVSAPVRVRFPCESGNLQVQLPRKSGFLASPVSVRVRRPHKSEHPCESGTLQPDSFASPTPLQVRRLSGSGALRVRHLAGLGPLRSPARCRFGIFAGSGSSAGPAPLGVSHLYGSRFRGGLRPPRALPSPQLSLRSQLRFLRACCLLGFRAAQLSRSPTGPVRSRLISPIPPPVSPGQPTRTPSVQPNVLMGTFRTLAMS
jgi:hypothetical protein